MERGEINESLLRSEIKEDVFILQPKKRLIQMTQPTKLMVVHVIRVDCYYGCCGIPFCCFDICLDALDCYHKIERPVILMLNTSGEYFKLNHMKNLNDFIAANNYKITKRQTCNFPHEMKYDHTAGCLEGDLVNCECCQYLRVGGCLYKEKQVLKSCEELTLETESNILQIPIDHRYYLAAR